MAQYIIPQIKLGGERHMQFIDHVIVDDKWLDTHGKLSAAYAYKGQGWGAYYHPVLPYSKELEQQMYTLHAPVDPDAKAVQSAAWFDEAELLKITGMSKETLTNGDAKLLTGAQAWDMSKLIKPVAEFGPCPYATEIDRAAWTAGVAGINAAGTGDYLTGAAWVADISYAGITANIGGRYDSAVTETARIDAPGDCGGFSFSLFSSGVHGGNPNAGYLVTINHSSIAGCRLRLSNCAGVNIYGLNTISLGTVQFLLVPAVVGNDYTLSVYNCLFNNNETAVTFINIADDDIILAMYCNKFFNHGAAYALTLANSTSPGTVENNIIYSAIAGSGGINSVNDARTYRNNIIVVADVAFLNIATGGIGRNNYSSGTTGEDADFATGSGNIVNGDISIFRSVNPLNPNFLRPKSTAAVVGAAATPTLSTTDIAGVTWATPSCIGCHEVMSPASIAEAVWQYITRELATGTPAVPADRAEKYAKAVWEYVTRTLSSSARRKLLQSGGALGNYIKGLLTGGRL